MAENRALTNSRPSLASMSATAGSCLGRYHGESRRRRPASPGVGIGRVFRIGAGTHWQLAPAAIWAGVPSRAPFLRGRPRLPVGAGLGPYSTDLAGSRVVHVLLPQISAWPWKAASPTPWMVRPGNAAVSVMSIWAARSTWEAGPLRHSRSRTGSSVGEGHQGSLT